ncbi:oxidoreductase [Thiohalorhabdus denitrificans]|uniref:Dihydroorotate oxidase B, electron transfer subunit n=1 Tax=Thiohalorhabdus denitrificans TaxID=381306 RepID=A0A0N8PMS4_9GAMM|nr:dihydroorotate dehydrogenase electron transfer subunit [Thiohalorhabdus denitrificans]KPV39533.1 oxidoreductase [Thiohalorhabdus denitrificans]SCX99519.1 dihydroorotate oxidase B, electron transfer subunit [Thiohalorhabdus denitrificans]
MTRREASIFVEDAEVLAHRAWPGEQFELRVRAPETAARARPGQFAHLRCAPELPMRRPLSIQRVEPEAGVVEFLYKRLGHGTRLLARREPGEALSLMGPIGQPFRVDEAVHYPVLIGGGVGIPPMVFLAETLKDRSDVAPAAFLGSEVPFPFETRPSELELPGLPTEATHADARLEDWGVPSRLASLAGLPGAYEGYVTDLARAYLEPLAPAERRRAAIFAVGPEPMLAAAARLGRELGVATWVSLEEYMACAVGGCAGCTVRVEEPTGPAMRRVCVDGPVFPAERVFPEP